MLPGKRTSTADPQTPVNDSGRCKRALRAFRAARAARLTGENPGKVLDVGCGDGSFLEALARRGWEVSGTELSESIATAARARLGDNVLVGNI
ncbi:class I SAM-dependent methyltransferase, partial [Petrachloros mirabilis]